MVLRCACAAWILRGLQPLLGECLPCLCGCLTRAHSHHLAPTQQGDYRTLAQPPSPTADLAALCSQLCDSSAPASPVGESPSGASSPAPSSGGSSGILA